MTTRTLSEATSNAANGEKILSFEEMRAVCCECRFPHDPATLIAKYAMQRFDECIFGPAKWLAHFDAIPVTLPFVESLRSRASDYVRSYGINTAKPVQEMGSDECANLLGITGDEDFPEIPEELHFCLNNPVRPGENLAAFTCAVTYIPEYVRKDGKVMAVTSRTLGLIFGPAPKQGLPVTIFGNPAYSLDKVLTDADTTQPRCYSVMELNALSNQENGIDKMERALAVAKIQQQGWEVPDARSFMATVITRRAWKDQALIARAPTHLWGYIPGQGISKDLKTPILLGVSAKQDQDGRAVWIHCQDSIGDEGCGVLGAKKFPAKTRVLA